MKILNTKWMLIALTAGSIYIGNSFVQADEVIQEKQKPAQIENQEDVNPVPPTEETEGELRADEEEV